jgi:hypothetical protein
MVGKAVASALAGGAGEIIVSDNHGRDGTLEMLRSRFSDPRLRIIEQPANIGMWPNHLALVRESKLPLVKFVQADDWIEPGGLAAMVEHMTPQTAVVGQMQLNVNLDTGERFSEFNIDRPIRFTSDQYMQRLLVVGQELSCPSCTLFRKSAMELTDQAWDTTHAGDFICNVIAASRGEVVLLPAGPVAVGFHAQQCTYTEGLERHVRTWLNCLKYLKRSSDPRVRRVGRNHAFIQGLGFLRTAAAYALRGGSFYEGFANDLLEFFQESISWDLFRDWPSLRESLRLRYSPRGGGQPAWGT